MRYIILCGGEYPKWKTPRQLLTINEECILDRTIRLLRSCGVKDIAISTNNEKFNGYKVNIIHHSNSFVSGKSGYWVDAFPLTDEPVCYIFGDVVFSPQAIYTIVNTEAKGIKFFASAPPFDKRYIKRWAEPFAFKVNDTEHFAQAIQRTKELQDKGMFNRVPIAWELWQVIKGTDINVIDYTNYDIINDITCDVDGPEDIMALEREYNRLWQNI